MQKLILLAAAIAGLTAVIFGAFGAHILRSLLSPDHLAMWEKGVQYQVYHALAMLLCYLFLKKDDVPSIRNAALCFLAGIVCFSGSLYLLATREITGIPAIILGPVTPIGGFFFILGWGFIFIQAIREEK